MRRVCTRACMQFPGWTNPEPLPSRCLFLFRLLGASTVASTTLYEYKLVYMMWVEFLEHRHTGALAGVKCTSACVGECIGACVRVYAVSRLDEPRAAAVALFFSLSLSLARRLA